MTYDYSDRTAAIAFLGTAIDGTHPNVLALQSSAAGSATKVGVQILDRTGAALALDLSLIHIFFRGGISSKLSIYGMREKLISSSLRGCMRLNIMARCV